MTNRGLMIKIKKLENKLTAQWLSGKVDDKDWDEYTKLVQLAYKKEVV